MKLKSRAVVIVGTVTLCTLAASSAAAVITGLDGNSMVQRRVVTRTTGTVVSSTSFGDIEFAATTIKVATGSRLVTARFTAENRCTGTGANFCLVQIVARGPIGTVEMHPQSNVDAAFAWATPDTKLQSNSVARAIRLTAGTWTIAVQAAVTSAGVSARYDDWILEVDVNN
jgi:hypothetical protein